MKIPVPVFFLCICFLQTTEAQTIRQWLHKNWQFKSVSENRLHPASVPGCVHTDLLKNKLITDPFYGDQEKKLQWIHNSDWVYQTVFSVNPDIYKQKHIELVFDGLDTYATVYLNDSVLLTSNNMFRQWKTDIKKTLHQNNNRLKIIFRSPYIVTDSFAKKELPLIIPDHPRLYARKAQYQFGWDFAPKLTTCGIWKNVYLEARQDLKIEQITHRITNNDPDHFEVEIGAAIFADSVKETTIYAEIVLQNKQTAIQARPAIKPDKTVSFKKIILQPGFNKIDVPFTIDHPQFWEPNGSGEQPLYKITVYIDKENASKLIGLRTIQLITQSDSLSDFPELQNKNGTGFYFAVNKKPVFIKGANFVPADMFPSRVNRSRYRELLVAAKEANMNMLRVWGGGIYEADDFYELCDSLGIMVWQDFMFAGSMLPTDTLFFQNVQQEATEQIRRLQNHPCLALWCGNNEIDEAWHNWGWQHQFQLSAADSAKLWNSYKKIFHELLPQLVNENSTGTAYWPSSPSVGWGRKESLTQGDCHYWGVWWGLDSIEKYRQKIPRFMSEYGMQSMPSMYTINRFSKEKERDTSNTIIKTHQKHPTGFKTLTIYLDRMFSLHADSAYLKWQKVVATNEKQSMDYFVYLTQVLQAETYKLAIETHRTHHPYNMGTLLWQLNDPWPVASWSIIDYYGNKKPAYYQAKESYEPVITATEKINEHLIRGWICNNSVYTADSIDFTITSINESGYQESFYQSIVSIKPHSVFKIDMELDTSNGQKNNQIFSYLTKYIKEKDSFQYFALSNTRFGKYEIPLELDFPLPKIKPVFTWVHNKLMVTSIYIHQLYSNTLFNGFLYHPEIKNIVAAPYQHFRLNGNRTEKLKLCRPFTESEFKKIRFASLNYGEVQ
jgi:beta-mannosidase